MIKYRCLHCGGYNIEVSAYALFDPNRNWELIQIAELSTEYIFCHDCGNETEYEEESMEESQVQDWERQNIMMKEPNNE